MSIENAQPKPLSTKERMETMRLARLAKQAESAKASITTKPISAKARMEEMRQARLAESTGDFVIPEEEEIDITEELEEVTGERKIPARPPETPAAALRQARREAGQSAQEQIKNLDVQSKDVVPAFEVNGFDGLEVVATLEKKNERKGKEAKNEDNIIADPETGLIGVLDGLGEAGEKAGKGLGQLASMTAERNLPKHYKEQAEVIQHMVGSDVVKALVKSQLTRTGEETPEMIAELKRQGKESNHERLTEQMENLMLQDSKLGRKALALLEAVKTTSRDVKDSGGQTTACVGFIHTTPNGERMAVVANVGDSGAIIRKKDGSIIELTKEDSLLNVIQANGTLTKEMLGTMKSRPKEKFPVPISLELVQAIGGTKKDFEDFKTRGTDSFPISYEKLKKSMVGALGGSDMEASLATHALEDGDELIIMTDGVYDFYEDIRSGKLNDTALAQDLEDSGTSTERLNYLRERTKSRSQQTEYAHKAEGDDIGIIKASVK